MKKILSIIIVACILTHVYSQNYGDYRLYTDINFENGTADDLQGNSQVVLLNGATVTTDTDRAGKVLYCPSATKGALKFNNSPLHDNMTISFWFKREDSNPNTYWRMMFSFTAADNSKIYFTPLTNWSNLSQLIYDNQAYNVHITANGKAVTNNQWTHYAIVFSENTIMVYQDGEKASSIKVVPKLSDMNANNWFFGNDPNQNFPMEGKLDDIKIFHSVLAPNQIKTLKEQNQVPEPVDEPYEADPNPVIFTVNPAIKYQTIANFGSSSGWFAEPVGSSLTTEKKEKIAELLFSRDFDSEGNPKGIGLSAWRFHIGSGTAEQGDASRIENPLRRTECFLNADGSYNWNKQAGSRWFLVKASLTYQVPDIIGWLCVPPVYYTVRGLGFREYNDPKQSILKADKYNAYGGFLADVVLHFKDLGIHFNYISPLNEPQFNHAPTIPGGTYKQEGSPWTNQEIKNVVQAIDNQFRLKNVGAKLFVTESGSIDYLTDEVGLYAVSRDQINELWKPSGPHYIGNIPSMSKIISSHSYMTDQDDNTIVSTRKKLSTRISQLASDYQYWQTEYALDADSYLWGHPAGRPLTSMERGISAARIIHNDLAVGNATGWQWWTTFEIVTGNYQEERFGLIPVSINNTQTDGVFRTTKLLYTLGNYSRFVRPGMKRIEVSRSDNKTDVQAVSTQMVSAYIHEETSEVVIVAVNASLNACNIQLKINNLSEELIPEGFTPYVTTDKPEDNLKKYPTVSLNENFILPPTSVVTFVSKMKINTKIPAVIDHPNTVSIAPNPATDFLKLNINTEESPVSVQLIDLTGKIINQLALSNHNDKDMQIAVRNVDAGIYLLKVSFKSFTELNKIIIKH